MLLLHGFTNSWDSNKSTPSSNRDSVRQETLSRLERGKEVDTNPFYTFWPF